MADRPSERLALSGHAPGWATGYAAGQQAERDRVRRLADEVEAEYLTGSPLDACKPDCKHASPGNPVVPPAGAHWHPFSQLIEQTAPQGDPQ